ncbi:threonine/serine exporter family protein [bacterium]|nr:threonine/serine exporter family protein [bacterium]
MIASIIPLVPGGGMYFTMLASFEGDPMKMTELGMSTIMTAAAIAAGLAIANAFGRIIFAALIHPLLQRKRKL